jgi:hypothetical protein
MKIRSVGVESFHMDGGTDRDTECRQMDRHDEANSLSFRNVANATNNCCIISVLGVITLNLRI